MKIACSEAGLDIGHRSTWVNLTHSVQPETHQSNAWRIALTTDRGRGYAGGFCSSSWVDVLGDVLTHLVFLSNLEDVLIYRPVS